MVLAVLLKEVDVLLNEVDEQLIQLDKLKQSKADNLHPNTTCPEKAEILEGTSAQVFAYGHYISRIQILPPTLVCLFRSLCHLQTT